jgi:hypothetical protein
MTSLALFFPARLAEHAGRRDAAQPAAGGVAGGSVAGGSGAGGSGAPDESPGIAPQGMRAGAAATAAGAVVGLFQAWDAPEPRPGAGLAGKLAAKVRSFFWFRANPRTRAYMEARFHEAHPHGVFCDVRATPGWRELAGPAAEVVLLYPDAIGQGFGPLERWCREHRSTARPPEVLNGRRRRMALDAKTRRALGLRRVLERIPLLELASIPVFVVGTPFLLVWDLLRGHR